MMSENSNNDKDESIYFPIELDPFPFKSNPTGNIDNVIHSITKLNASSKLGESIEVKENKTENVDNANDGDPVWQRLAENYFGETQDNYIQKLEQFYEHLNQLQNNNRSERNGRLLNNIPTLKMTYPSSIYADNIAFKASLKLSSSNKDCCPFQTINFLLKFLRGGNHNNESATTLLLAYLQMMKDHPKYYDGFMNPDTIQFVYRENFMTILKHRDKFGRRVCITRPGYWNPDKIKFPDLFCAVFQLHSMISEEEKTQIAGCTVIIDAKNFGFKQLRNIAFEDIRVVVNFIQDVFPIWFRQIHIINAPRAFNILFGMMKPLFNERVRSIILFHDNLETLHTSVDKEMLPEELDGTNGKFCNEESVLAVTDMNEYFIQLKKYADYVNN